MTQRRLDGGLMDAAGVIVSQMTIREQVGQINQRLFGWRAVERAHGGFRLTDEARRELEHWSGLGAIYGLFRADPWSGRSWDNGIGPQERAEVASMVDEQVRAASPQGIGALVVEEAPHGHQALGGPALPVNLAMAATWDTERVASASAHVGRALAASGVHVALASGLDVARDPRWGRVEETFGDNPTLASRMVTAVVEGMQGPGRVRVGRGGVAVVMKHLAAQGAGVGGRNGQSSPIGPRELREVHLPPVVAAARAGALGFMAAYNDIDGVPCAANSWLLQDLLRDELGFDGIVMADGLAVDQLAPMTGGIAASGRAALLAGVDLSLWDEGFTTLEESASRDPAVRAAVGRAAARVVALKSLFGLVPGLEEAAVCPGGTAEEGEGTDLDAAMAAARSEGLELARESVTVLSDRGGAPVLPLSLGDYRRVCVVGPNADDLGCLLGDYSAPLPPGDGTSLAAAVSSRWGSGVTVIPRPAGDAEMAEIRDADLVICALGGTSERYYSDAFADTGALADDARLGGAVATSGEGVDLADLGLPGGQDDLVRSITDATNGVVVAVVISGRPHVMTGVERLCDAVVWVPYPGPDGGRAIVDVLTGAAPAAGLLPCAMPAASGVSPVYGDQRGVQAQAYSDTGEIVLHPLASGRVAGGPWQVHGLAADVGGKWADVSATVHRATGSLPLNDGLAVVIPLFCCRSGGITMPRRQELLDFARVAVPTSGVVDVRWRVPVEALFAEGSGPGATTRLWAGECELTIRR